ncbi:hypothetical protein BN6_19930 [Saccharothrix espanaensis DSM 44229]|uniref:SCP1.201-like deaminase n=1 Tax=Saccharothrix espanaensis (strain ATCC 51144 / DSM 44229 / JCM 9112 / NBRC 15066 / NRRL 15764) TaxID=1179773 RepID=K0JX08_SACES|nr:hypothetical protein BN6_19930 [Saccharothrix espanaensis DSM 44229]
MASLRAVAEAVVNAQAKARECEEALNATLNLVEDAQALLAVALEGDSTGEKDALLATLADVVRGVKDQLKVLDRAVGHTESFLAGLLGEHPPTTPPASSRTPSAQATPSAPATDPPSSLLPEKVEELRGDLPPTVVGGIGQKTHGRWVGPDGVVRSIVSGNGPEATDAGEFLQTLPLPQPGVPIAVSHVETKLAMHMRDTGVRHAAVVINNRPCAGRFGCETLVGLILPEGSTLTVYGSGGYEQTIRGGLRPPWQR